MAGFGLPNFGQLTEAFKKAKQIQQDAQKLQDELENMEIEGKSDDEMIKVWISGNQLPLKVEVQENILNADNFIWNIENTNYLLEGNIRFENQNIILNSRKAILGSDNIIEFFNPVEYIIKDENNENKYEINSENAYYNIDTDSVSFKAKDKRVKSIIYF